MWSLIEICKAVEARRSDARTGASSRSLHLRFSTPSPRQKGPTLSHGVFESGEINASVCAVEVEPNSVGVGGIRNVYERTPEPWLKLRVAL